MTPAQLIMHNLRVDTAVLVGRIRAGEPIYDDAGVFESADGSRIWTVGYRDGMFHVKGIEDGFMLPSPAPFWLRADAVAYCEEMTK